jgi:hypothetical protein
MNILTGIQNFLSMINENWTTIIIIIGLAIGVVNRLKKYLQLTNEEKVTIAKAQLKEIVLKLVSEAECDYAEWKKAGSIKRSQVIDEIFEKYPVLSKVAEQNDVIAWIDEEIDNALITLRDVISENQEIAVDKTEN